MLQKKPKNWKTSGTFGIFFEMSLKEPLDDGNALPPALAGQKAAYSALSQEQKVHLSNDLLPLLLARKDELANAAIDGLGTFNANSWLRVLCALAHFDTVRHKNRMDCCISTHPVVDARTKRPILTQ